jgi:hypothetical protein
VEHPQERLLRNLSPDAKTPELRDFRYIGIIWVVQVKQGWRSEFYRLSDLQRYLAEGRVQPTDLLSYDRETWIAIDQIDDLQSHFETVWHLANQGKLRVRHEIGRGSDFDDEAPTRVVSIAQLQADLLAGRQGATDPLRLTPPDIEAFEMPEEDVTGMYDEIELDSALIVEDEPTMEPQAGRIPIPKRAAQDPVTRMVRADAPPGMMVRVFLSGLLSGLALFGLLVWLTKG